MLRYMPENFSVGVFTADIFGKTSKRTVRRIVETYEIEYALEDGGTTYINDTPYDIKKHNFICAKPGQVRYTDLPYRCLYIHADLPDTETAHIINSMPDLFIPKNPGEYYRIMNDLIENYSTPSVYSDIRLVTLFFELMEILIKENKREYLSQDRKKSTEYILKKALGYIDTNFREKITLEDIAAHVHLSKIYFHNLFKNTLGISTHDYILEKRLSLAKELLLTNTHSICDIAAECGFSSQSYLNFIFKQQYNITPKQYIQSKNQL